MSPLSRIAGEGADPPDRSLGEAGEGSFGTKRSVASTEAAIPPPEANDDRNIANFTPHTIG